jgi:hypothetical protein
VIKQTARSSRIGPLVMDILLLSKYIHGSSFPDSVGGCIKILMFRRMIANM